MAFTYGNIFYGDVNGNTNFVLGSAKTTAALTLSSTGVLVGTVAVGEAVIVYVSINGTTTISSVTDSVGNTYSLKIGANNGTSCRIEIWATIVTQAISVGATLKVTPSASATIAVAAEIYSGVVSFGNTASLTGSGNGPSVNVATQDPNNWVAAGCAWTGTATASQGIVQGDGFFRHGTGTSGGSASTNSGVGSNDNTTLYPGANNIQGAPPNCLNSLTLSVNETNIMAGLELRSPTTAGTPFYTYLCGFELGNIVGEASRSVTGSPSVSTSIVHGGKYSMRCNPTAATAYIEIEKFTNQALNAFACSLRFYLYVSVFPNLATMICTGTDVNSISFYQCLLLNPDGTMSIEDGVGVLATSTNKLTTGAWHQISFVTNPNNGSNSVALYVDGSLWASVTSTSGNTTTYAIVWIGAIGRTAAGGSENITCDLYFDDILIESGANGAINVGPGQQVLLLPTADNSIAGWTGGAGGVTNLFKALDNIPPVGVTAPGTNTSQIRNASSTGNSDYTATCQSYIAAGVPAGATVNAVTPIVSDSVEVAVSIFGLLWMASNPVQAIPNLQNQFTYGLGIAEGTFPTGWQPDEGPVTNYPTLTLSSSPTITLRKIGTTTSVCGADFFGVYVDYGSGAGPSTASRAENFKVFWMG